MSRTARSEVFDPSEIATVRVTKSVVKTCFLMGMDAVTGEDFIHRKN